MNIVNNKSFATSIKYIYLSFCLLCFFEHFFSSVDIIDSFLVSFETYLPIIGIVLVLLFTCININLNNNIIIGVCLLYCFATAIGNGVVNNEYIFLAILAFLFANENPKYLFRFLLIFYLIFLSINLTLSHLGFFPYELFGRGDQVRHAFNFYHPNSLGIFCLSTYSLICYVLRKYKLIIISSGCALFYFAYYYVNSRTSGLLILFVLVLHILYWSFLFIYKLINFKPEILNTIFKYIIISIPFLCFVFSIYSSFAYSPDNSFWAKLDAILSARLSLQHNAILNDGIPLLGIQKVFVDYPVYNIIDNLYMQLIYRYGLIFEITILSLITYLINKNINRFDLFTIFWLIIAWSLFSLSEPFALYFCFNPFILLLFNNYKDNLEVIHE